MSDQNKTAMWLFESFERYKIEPARGLADLTAHYTGTVAPPLGLAFAQFLKRRETKGTGWSQRRPRKAALDDFAASPTHPDVSLVTEDEVLADSNGMTGRSTNATILLGGSGCWPTVSRLTPEPALQDQGPTWQVIGLCPGPRQSYNWTAHGPVGLHPPALQIMRSIVQKEMN